ncbi:MAG TPA: 6,7-dimethyl-8-ribityllumazine synthase, partial [Cyanobacteria bacterium UBA11372]|nr:6,7-dimethyl-8-ribityllumazine synthase [Cyanobacteria bacterium UBA11372]
LMAHQMALTHRYDAVICLGAVIRGQTPHFDYVAAEVSKGIAAASFQTGVPVVFGVVTVDNMQQALERAGIKSNKGWEFAMSALEMASLMRQVKASSTTGTYLNTAAAGTMVAPLKSALPQQLPAETSPSEQLGN